MENRSLLDKYPNQATYLAICGLSALLTLVVSMIVFLLMGLAPFGNRALIYSDGQHQMIDLLCWYKDVLAGKSSIGYTFSKSLGGSNFAVFTYYLASPFSLLIVFFDKASAPLFMNILFALKAATAGAFASYYLLRRFRPTTSMQQGITLILSVSYALSPFFIAQSSNTMWLDGAYMLPLILAGCEKIVAGEHSMHFSISVGLALCFNWYSGIVDLMFACFWLLFEVGRKIILTKNDSPDKKASSPDKKAASPDSEHAVANASQKPQNTRKSILFIFLRFALACICAILLSAALLLPTLMKLSSRTHGSSGMSMLKDLSLLGPVTDSVANYAFGMISVKGSVCLFAGSFVLIGVILLFLAGKKTGKEKGLFGGLLAFSLLMFFWQPLVAVFSMLRVVESYWYRYTYLGAFVLIVLAAEFYLNTEICSDGSDSKEILPWMPVAVTGFFCLIVFLLSKIQGSRTVDLVFAATLQDFLQKPVDPETAPILAKVLFPLLFGISMYLFLKFKDKSPIARRVLSGLISVLVVIELTFGQVILSQFYSTDNALEIANYTQRELALLPENETGSFYRIVQTTYHSTHFSSPSSYNEPLAYGFPSVTSFVSDPDENAIFFLDKAGYPQYSETITVTSGENLALDSLLNVRYILLDIDDPNTIGLENITGIAGFKKLYINPYSAPNAFVYAGTGNYDSGKTRPAEYLNDMYRKLSGTERGIFEEVQISTSQNENTFHYEADLGEDFDPNGQILYMNLETNTDQGAKIFVDGKEYMPYSQFLAPRQIRIPTEKNSVTIELVFNGDASAANVTDAQFYVLDLSALDEAVKAMKLRSCTSCEMEDGHCRFEVEGSSGDSLFTTVPSEKGWTVTRNGQKIEPDILGGALMSIPLENGTNTIEMTYRVPYLSVGIALSIAGIAALAVVYVLERKRL
ncbi:MAG: YfhO family protein [Clostridiales bacterium]|nr:YfhO family protein [Clostridiales bacterium]